MVSDAVKNKPYEPISIEQKFQLILEKLDKQE